MAAMDLLYNSKCEMGISTNRPLSW